jgi:hypothetical protein
MRVFYEIIKIETDEKIRIESVQGLIDASK